MAEYDVIALEQENTLIVFTINSSEIGTICGINLINQEITKDNYEEILPLSETNSLYTQLKPLPEMGENVYTLENPDLSITAEFTHLIAFSKTKNETGNNEIAFITTLPVNVYMTITRQLIVHYLVLAQGIVSNLILDYDEIYKKHIDDIQSYAQLEDAHPDFIEDGIVVDFNPSQNFSERNVVRYNLEKYNDYMHSSDLNIRVVNPFKGEVIDPTLKDTPQVQFDQKITFLQEYITKTKYLYFWLNEYRVSKALRNIGVNSPGDRLGIDGTLDATDTLMPQLRLGFNEMTGPYLYSYYTDIRAGSSGEIRSGKVIISIYGCNSSRAIDVYVIDATIPVENPVDGGPTTEIMDLSKHPIIVNRFLDKIYFTYDGRIFILNPSNSGGEGSYTDEFVYKVNEDDIGTEYTVNLSKFPENTPSLPEEDSLLLNRKGLPYGTTLEKILFNVSNDSKTNVLLSMHIDKNLTGLKGKLAVEIKSEDVYSDNKLSLDPSTNKSSLIMFEFSDLGDIFYSTYNRTFINIFGHAIGSLDEKGNERQFQDIINDIQYTQLSKIAIMRLQYLYEMSASQYILLDNAYYGGFRSTAVVDGEFAPQFKFGQAAAIVSTEMADGTKKIAYYPKEPRLSRNRVRVDFESNDWYKYKWDINNHLIVQEDSVYDCLNGTRYSLASEPFAAFSRGILVRRDERDLTKVAQWSDGQNAYQGAFSAFFLTEQDPYPIIE